MEEEHCSYPVGDCVCKFNQGVNQKINAGILLEYFRHSTLFFKGRVDEGNITIRELMDFNLQWVSKHIG